ncbi:MAG: hypothetical protein VX085_14195 [Pseudomonadota bacterium]|nr:hypothetical protein [Pseudomonadota bacterium]
MLVDFKALTTDKMPRRDERLANSATIQSGLARSEIKLGAVRAFALKTLADIYESASSNGVIHIPDHARVQLATANAIHGAIGTADWVYKQVGVHAIFTVNTFQRRFRSI